MEPKVTYVHVTAGQTDDLNQLPQIKEQGYRIVSAYPTPWSLSITLILEKAL